ncbi:HNH endonuclease [Macrococcus capreoli]|uniref:HNH endonuclease n=1 Tax=Macrococcus capreoli TaxID=2982690 RepID=UPI0021D59C08|nr:HNH endonuclease [Macrococcus sp. TMW 2.2395]MCU7557266.1 HNH endonuclease [Macrococcus sp. TMW 2.2395]
MIALYIKCAHPRCRELIEKPDRYCHKHADATTQAKYNKDRYKYDKEYISFYKSAKWRNKRKKIIKRDNHLCQYCFKEGLIVAGNVVDHIIPSKVEWSKRLDDDNLQLLCHQCHNKKTRQDERKYKI